MRANLFFLFSELLHALINYQYQTSIYGLELVGVNPGEVADCDAVSQIKDVTWLGLAIDIVHLFRAVWSPVIPHEKRLHFSANFLLHQVKHLVEQGQKLLDRELLCTH